MSEEQKQEVLDRQIAEKELKVRELDVVLQELGATKEERAFVAVREKHELLRRAIEAGSNSFGKVLEGSKESESLRDLIYEASKSLTEEVKKL
jgi:hypothetical protein